MAFIDVETLYFVLSIVGLMAVGIGFIWKLSRKSALLEDSIERNHKCIERLETKMDDHKKYVHDKVDKLETNIDDIKNNITAIKENVADSREVHNQLRDESKEVKSFFTDWIQRLENVTRDRRIDEREEIIPLRPKSLQQEDKQQNNLEDKLDEIIKLLKNTYSGSTDKGSI